MLTEKPWRAEAIVRLLAAMFTCMMLGSLVLLVIRFNPAAATISATIFYSIVVAAAACLLGAIAFVARPWSLDNFKSRAAPAVVCLYLGIAILGFAQNYSGVTGKEATITGMLASTLSFQGAAIPLLWVFVRQHGANLRSGFGFGEHPRHAMLLGATVGLAFIPVGLGLQYGIAFLAKQCFGLELGEQNAVTILRLADSWTDRIALGVVTMILAPLAEEGLFRGVLFPFIRRWGWPQAALWSTAVVFALIHFNTLSFFPLMIFAVVLAKVYEKTNNLLACIVGHAAFNCFNYVMLFVTNTSSQPQ
ncbi:MAG: hypothetical protein RLY20_2317 [Verrucomicrobiota bacterium]|jgi:membrane protease YdiL (CAAX protease family)